MSETAFMWAIFCDDVREEIGNKFSCLGIYGPNLIVPAFPATLQKLCCVLSVRAPAKLPPKQVMIRLLRDDAVVFEADLSPTDQQPMPSHEQAVDKEAAAFTFSAVAQLLNVPVLQRGHLKARALVDGVELKGGSLELLSAADASQLP